MFGPAQGIKQNPITLLELGSAPSDVSDVGLLYTMDVAGATELFYDDPDAGSFQLTSGQGLNGAVVSFGVSAAGRVPYVGATGCLATDAGMTYDASTDALTVGKVLTGDGSAAAPSHSFSSTANTGFYLISPSRLGYTSGGVLAIDFGPTWISIPSNSGTVYIGASSDVVLTRDAANTLAQRNGTNAQTFRVYSTYTEGGAQEWIEIAAGTAPSIRTMAAGGGTERAIDFKFGSTQIIRLGSGITCSQPLLFSADNALNIGASGVNRPRSIYVGTSIVNAGYFDISEIAEPAAPAADTGRLFVKDNGSGKSQLCVRFATGATQVIATEP